MAVQAGVARQSFGLATRNFLGPAKRFLFGRFGQQQLTFLCVAGERRCREFRRGLAIGRFQCDAAIGLSQALRAGTKVLDGVEGVRPGTRYRAYGLMSERLAGQPFASAFRVAKPADAAGDIRASRGQFRVPACDIAAEPTGLAEEAGVPGFRPGFEVFGLRSVDVFDTVGLNFFLCCEEKSSNLT